MTWITPDPVTTSMGGIGGPSWAGFRTCFADFDGTIGSLSADNEFHVTSNPQMRYRVFTSGWAVDRRDSLLQLGWVAETSSNLPDATPDVPTGFQIEYEDVPPVATSISYRFRAVGFANYAAPTDSGVVLDARWASSADPNIVVFPVPTFPPYLHHEQTPAGDSIQQFAAADFASVLFSGNTELMTVTVSRDQTVPGVSTTRRVQGIYLSVTAAWGNGSIPTIDPAGIDGGANFEINAAPYEITYIPRRYRFVGAHPPLRQNQRDDARQNQRTSQQLTVRQRGYL